MSTRPPAAPDEEGIRLAWRDSSRDEPAPELDATVIAAARNAMAEDLRAGEARRARKPAWNGWQPMLAAAAVAAIAFTLAQTLPRQPDAGRIVTPQQVEPTGPAPQTQTQVPLPDSARSPAVAAIPPPDVPAESATRGVAASRAPSLADTAAPAATVPAPAESPMPQASTSEALAPAPAPSFAKEASADAAAQRPAAPPPPSAAAEAAPTEVQGIVHAYDRGDFEAAAAGLRQLRETTPNADALLPERLRAWAGTVR